MLRPYQIAAIDRVRAAFKSGSRSVCLVMPTGAGKTRTVGEIVKRAADRGKRVLWLAHRTELVDQTVRALTVASGTLSAAAESVEDADAPVQVATVQTLLARDLRPPADIIVADEAHHYVADTWQPLVASYADALVVGITATPERSDGRGLGDLFTRLVVGARVRELVDGGFLVPANLIAPREKLRTGQIAQRPADAYHTHTPGKRAIVFSPTVAEAVKHADEIRAMGYSAAVVSAETSWDVRRDAFDRLRAGTLNALVNVYVATEGFDIPEIECVILARGFGSAGTYLQCIGRSLRPAPGKTSATIVDLTGASHVHGHPEDDRVYSLEGRGIKRADEVVDQVYCHVCGAPRVAPGPCDECGVLIEAKQQTVTGEKLIPYANKRAEPIDARVETLRRWIGIGRDKGYKPGWALAKYRAVYGDWPAHDIRREAQP